MCRYTGNPKNKRGRVREIYDLNIAKYIIITMCTRRKTIRGKNVSSLKNKFVLYVYTMST